METTEKQSNIVTAAIEIIANRGYKELTMKNLAALVGVTDAALYKHYDSKHDLIMGILSYFETVSNRVLLEMQDCDCDPIHKVRFFVMNRYEMFSSNPELGKVMFSEEIFKNDNRYLQRMQFIMHAHKESVCAYLDRASQTGLIRSDVDSQQVFRIIVGSMRLLITQWNMNGHAFDLVEEGEKLWITIEKMIKEPK